MMTACFTYRACWHPEIGLLLAKLVAGERESVPVPGDDYEQRNADAFGRLMRRLATGDTPGSETVLTVVHRYPDGTARLEGGPPIPTPPSGSPAGGTPSGHRDP